MKHALPLLACMVLAACDGPDDAEAQSALAVESAAFAEASLIPEPFTCDGEDRSPPLRWIGAPDDARSFALVVDDPDAPRGTFTHWLVYDIPAHVHELAEDLPDDARLDVDALQGENDFGDVGYNGPCPPPGPAHRYRFVLSALDTPSLDLSPGARSEQVQRVIRGHVLARDTLTATYGR